MLAIPKKTKKEENDMTTTTARTSSLVADMDDVLTRLQSCESSIEAACGDDADWAALGIQTTLANACDQAIACREAALLNVSWDTLMRMASAAMTAADDAVEAALMCASGIAGRI